MCRKNQLCGCALVTFGLGILFGIWLESSFFCCFMAIAFMILGCWCAKKK